MTGVMLSSTGLPMGFGRRIELPVCVAGVPEPVISLRAFGAERTVSMLAERRKRRNRLQCRAMSSRRSRAPGIVVLGDINVDIVARMKNFAGLGEDCLIRELPLHCGGVAANVAVALAQWGVRVRLVGSTGRDGFGEHALRFLRRAGVDVSAVRRLPRATTGLMFIIVLGDGQRTILGSRGANEELAAPAENLFSSARGLHLVGYSFLSPSGAKTAEKLLDAAHRAKRWVALDVGMAPSREIPRKILQLARNVDILFVGREEAAALTRKPDVQNAFRALESAGAREVLMKLGDQGCLFTEDGALRRAPAFRVAAVDTTGAGDAFAAAFLRARLQNWPRAEATVLANAAGAAAAMVVGAGAGMPVPSQVAGVLTNGRFELRWEAVRLQVLRRLREKPSWRGTSGSKGGRHDS